MDHKYALYMLDVLDVVVQYKYDQERTQFATQTRL